MDPPANFWVKPDVIDASEIETYQILNSTIKQLKSPLKEVLKFKPVIVRTDNSPGFREVVKVENRSCSDDEDHHDNKSIDSL